MADEPIQISVTDTGTDAVAAKLEALGLSGEQAAAAIAAGFAKLSDGATVVAARFAMIQAAAQSGLGQEAVTALSTTINGLSEAQIRAAAGAQSLAGGARTAAEALGGLGAAAASSATNVTAVGTAATGAAAAVVKSSTAAKEAAVSFGTFGKGLGLITGLLSFEAFEKGSDEITRISNQLKQVTTSTAEFDTAYKSLYNTANQSQSSFEASTKLFFNLSEATKGAGISQQNLLTFVDTVAKAMYAQGASNAQVTRTLYELSEAAAKGTLSGRQFLSVAMNAPGLMDAFATGLGKTRKELSEMASGTGVASSKLQDATTTAEKASIALEELNQNTARHSIEAMNERQHITDLKNQLDHVTGAYNTLDTNSTNYYSHSNKLQQEKLKINEEISAANMQLGVIATEQDINNKKAQVLASKTATEAEKLDTITLVAAGDKANESITKLAASMHGTISGAFTDLSNKWADYIGKVNQASSANNFVIGTITAIGDHLNVIIPIIATFVAGWGISKVITAVSDLNTGITKLIPVIRAAGVASLEFLLTPMGLALVAVAIPLGILITRWDDFKAGLTVIGDVASKLWQNFSDGIDGGIKEISSWWDELKEAFPLIGKIQADFTDLWDKIKSGAQTVVDFFSNMFSKIGDWLNGLINDAKNLLDLASRILSSSSSKPTFTSTPSTGSTNPEARNGADWTVGGAGQATDSQLVQFMASPGERVVVQTPSQAANDNIPHMRNGGALAITGGLSGVNVTFVPSANSSVTGYTSAVVQAVQQLAAASPSPIARTGAASASGGDGGGAGDVLGQILSSMSIFQTSPIAFGRSVDALGYIQGNPLDTRYVPDWVGKILEQGISVTMYYRSLSRDTISSAPWGVHENTDIQKQYDLAKTNAIQYANGYGQGFSMGGGPFSGGSIDTGSLYMQSVAYTRTAQDLLNKGAIPWNFDPLNANKVPYTSNIPPPGFVIDAKSFAQVGLGELDTSDDPAQVALNAARVQANAQADAAARTEQQRQDLERARAIFNRDEAQNKANAQSNADAQANVHGVTNPDPFAFSGGGSNNPSYISSSGSVSGLRDGGDFIVPGAGAVDSRMLQFMVTPGEQVSVKRPQDQRNSLRENGNTTIVNMNVVANDVDSFRRSSQQLDMQLQRRLSKVAQRVRS